MGFSFFKYVEKVINALPKTINTIKDTQGFVNAVNSWEDGECKQAALDIIKNSDEFSDEEKVQKIKELNKFVNEQKQVAATEISKQQILITKILIAVLTAGISVPVEGLLNLRKGKEEKLLNTADFTEILEEGSNSESV